MNFEEKILNSEPFYIKNFFTKFFSWKDLENLLNLRPFVNARRFKITGENKNYSWPNRTWLTDVNTWPPNFIKEVIMNEVCYFTDCSRVNRQVNEICSKLETLTNKPTDAHIYFDYTGKKGKGFSAHWDYSHNLIIQMEGETNFKIWNFFADDEKIRNVDTIEQEPFTDVLMKSGDAVFVPAKMWHQAISHTKRLSISFPMAVSSQDVSDIQEREWIELKNGV